MRIIICGCASKNLEYLTQTLGLIAQRRKTYLSITAPYESERNDDLCRYITLDEDIHTDIGKGMADALIVYQLGAGIRQIENLRHDGMLILIRDEEEAARPIDAYSGYLRAQKRYLEELVYLKPDAVTIERTAGVRDLFEFYAEEKVLRLLGLR